MYDGWCIRHKTHQKSGKRYSTGWEGGVFGGRPWQSQENHENHEKGEKVEKERKRG